VVTRTIASLAVAAVAALLLAACGSSDSGSSDSSSTGGAVTETSAGGEPTGGSHGENDAGGKVSEQSGSGKTPSGFTPEEVESPLKVSGGGSEQFRTKGGDNSVQEFGEESGESELQEAAEQVHDFFVARAVGDWEKACSYLSKSMSEQLKQLATSSTKLGDKSCASFLEAFTGRLSASAWRENTTVDAGSLRLDGEQAFLIYYGAPNKTVYAMPLAREDETFKVGALAGDPLG
jgi:hypothetical protein